VGLEREPERGIVSGTELSVMNKPKPWIHNTVIQLRALQGEVQHGVPGVSGLPVLQAAGLDTE